MLLEDKPSIYELIAKDELDNLLDEAFNQLIQESTQKTLFLYKNRYFLYFGIKLLLSTESLSEQFYGLKRNRYSRMTVVEWCIYPTLCQIFNIDKITRTIGLVFKIGYMYGITKYSPWLYLTKQDIIRAKSTNSFQILFPLILMSFRFIDFYKQIPKPKKPIPPPMHHLLTKRDSKCLICMRHRTNEALAFNYVYCYSCIYQYVQENGKCPFGNEMETSEIIKIYHYYINII